MQPGLTSFLFLDSFSRQYFNVKSVLYLKQAGAENVNVKNKILLI